MKTNYIHLDETKSTNSYMADIAATAEHGTVVYTDRQTAGRGQRGNSWESEPFKNVTMSILLRPKNVAPNQQFWLSEISALAVERVLSKYIGNVSIKWPNDIYYKDFKICGMLIEHSLSGGKICYTIPGIGINVNQQVFLSDAPNPISLANVLGHEVPTSEILDGIVDEILTMCDLLPEKADEIHREFLSKLYRRDGFHEYQSTIRSTSADGLSVLEEGEHFQARIVNVHPDGMLDLMTTEGHIHTFAFKEVAFVLG